MSSIQHHLVSVHKRDLTDYTINDWHCEGRLRLPTGHLKHTDLSFCSPMKAGNIPILFNQVWVDNDYVMVWVSVLGTKEEAGKLEYSLRFYNVRDRDERRKNYLFWGTMACVPCDISHEEMKFQRLGCGLSRQLMDKYGDGKVFYDIKFAKRNA